ncbi:MAG: hypothetical protein QNJ16_20485 [Rhodobacter sp.]|nr:hypothetical protein [Rhodobacter sp.]
MGLTAALIGLMALEAAQTLSGDAGIACVFPPSETTPGASIEFKVDPTPPSLRDMPDLHRVSMQLNRKMLMFGAVQRAQGADTVLFRARSQQDHSYTIGLHRTGVAVLTIQSPKIKAASRPGKCVGHGGYMQRWIGQ